jgi:MSHA biogenesis protein MshN
VSVINKMLRDLDQRQAANRADAAGSMTAPLPDLHRGTHRVVNHTGAAMTSSNNGRLIWLSLLGVALAIALVAAGWAWMKPPVLDGAVALAKSPTPTPTPTHEEPLAAAPELTAVAASKTAVAPPPSKVLTLATSPKLLDPPKPPSNSIAKGLESTTASATASAASVSTMALRREPALSESKVPDATPPNPEHARPDVAASVDALASAERQQQASSDALAQAQNLWNSGSRAAAVDLLQQSVDAAERAVKAGTSSVGNPVVVLLVREWSRMQLVEARFVAVWDMLSRMEPVLGNQPDLWAIRANAAQRLGRHQDSVSAYHRALQSRPDEQRWLLGAAVSMAALGQISEATEMAEKARSVGEISPDVQVYLRQMGVQLIAK